MLKFRKNKAFAFVEALIALMIATLTVLLLSFILGNSLKREKNEACTLNEYSNQLMKLHESRLSVPYTEKNKEKDLDSKKKDEKSSKTKEQFHYKKTTSKTAPTSISIHCNQEEVIRIEGMGSTEKVSISSD